MDSIIKRAKEIQLNWNDVQIMNIVSGKPSKRNNDKR